LYNALGFATLKTGEVMEVGIVAAPDSDYKGQLRCFLDHKPDEFKFHIEAALERPLDNLTTRFFIGQINGSIVAQVMIVGDNHAGILGHVFTAPDYRRKGACAQIMGYLMPNCLNLGYLAITLSTGFDSPAYRIYHSFGFRSVADGSGIMKWLANGSAESFLLGAAPTTVRPVQWEDWPYFNLLAAQLPFDSEDIVRSKFMAVAGTGTAEGPFLRLRQECLANDHVQALSLVNDRRASVGWAILSPDDYWFGDGHLLDLYVHPNYRDQTSSLLEAISWPAGSITCYTTGQPGTIESTLSQYGFTSAGTCAGLIPGARNTELTILIRR
jgi:GNAT superfamily N-acetyltransferase